MKLAKRIQLKPITLIEKLLYRSKNFYNGTRWYAWQQYFNIGEWICYAQTCGMDLIEEITPRQYIFGLAIPSFLGSLRIIKNQDCKEIP